MASNDTPEAVVPSESKAIAMADEKDLSAHDHIVPLGATDRVIQAAKAAAKKEESMTLLQGIRLYPKAIAWSMLISTCIVMEGYDVCLINNFCGCFTFRPSNGTLAGYGTRTNGLGWLPDAFPQFNRKYGEQLPSGKWEVTAPWQAGLSNVSARLSMTAGAGVQLRAAAVPLLAPGSPLGFPPSGTARES